MRRHFDVINKAIYRMDFFADVSTMRYTYYADLPPARLHREMLPGEQD